MTRPLRSALAARWNGAGGWREVLAVSFPLILSSGSWSLQHFVDRMFLAWYGPDAIAAAMPAGILNFTLMSVFLGTACYVSTFTAQYHGAGRTGEAGPVLAQGLWVSAAGAATLLATVPFAPPVFAAFGHPEAVRAGEVTYYRILCAGALPALASATLGSYFSGLGRTWPVMWVNVGGTAVNLLGDYALVFGNWGLPRMGIAGAALATNLSVVFTLAAYLVLLRLHPAARPHRPLARLRFDRPRFARLVHFGFPTGLQFFIDMAGFTVFLLLVGRLGTEALAASNIAFNINTLAFMPMLGIGIGISVLVGQALGRDDPASARRATWSGFHLTFGYMGAVALAYVAVPALFVEPFGRHADPAAFAAIGATAEVLLRFVAAYSLFDTMNIVFASALKGAGDTRFIIKVIAALSWGVLVVPAALALTVFGAGLYAIWGIATLYVCCLGLAFLGRFRHGAWASMRVIGEAPEIVDIPAH